MRTRSYSKYLSETYGGKWKYDRKSSCWLCDDGKREVRCVCSLDEDPDSRFPPNYVMYDGGGFLAYVSCPDKDLRRFLPLRINEDDRP